MSIPQLAGTFKVDRRLLGSFPANKRGASMRISAGEPRAFLPEPAKIPQRRFESTQVDTSLPQMGPRRGDKNIHLQLAPISFRASDPRWHGGLHRIPTAHGRAPSQKDARIIAAMPARVDSGSLGQAATDEPGRGSTRESVPHSAPRCSEIAKFVEKMARNESAFACLSC